jgi:antitoxin component of RelBE/YafQ-DinJ toxin-antitoxin module
MVVRAFISLLERRWWFAVPAEFRLPALLRESLRHREDITEQLGVQVRQAVEMLVAAFARSGAVPGDVSATEVYLSLTRFDGHRQIDVATVRAYGWDDLANSLGHGFHDTHQGTRYTVASAPRQEILDRLLELNHAATRKRSRLACTTRNFPASARSPRPPRTGNSSYRG